MKNTFRILLLICLSASANADENPIGFRSATLADERNERPLDMVVWYPAKTTAPAQLIADDAVFVGTSAVREAPPTAGDHPLLVLSHGFRGNWSNQAWLASALARQGYIVAAVNHPGTTTHDRSPKAAARLWQRPVDISRVIDAVTAQPEQFGAVSKGRIAVAGHSLGGWTALEIAGTRFDPERFAQDCAAHQKLATRLPSATSQYVEISDASHFSFMSLCKPGAVALLEEDSPGDGIICADGDARSREVIQQQVVALIDGFLSRSVQN